MFVINVFSSSDQIRKRSPCTGSKTPLLVAWDSVEEIVRDGIVRNRQAFYNMLRTCDLEDTGFISRINFKKIMRTFCPVLTGEHLIKLCSKFQDTASGRILYKKLLASIGMSGSAPTSPRVTPVDQPLSAHAPKEEQRIKTTEDKTPLTKNMTQEEVIEKLKNCVQQHDPDFRKQFLAFGKGPNGKINEHDFRKVLEANGMPMDDDQFTLLTTKIGFREEGMSYLDFAAGFKDTEMSRPASRAAQTAIWRKRHLDSHFATAEECLKLFPQRLRESFQDPYSAFFKMDTDRDGILSMLDFRRLLLHLLFNLKDEEFERVLELQGLKLGMTLNFREFRNLCEKGSYRTDEAPQRLVRPKQKVTDSELACEQAHQYLVTKAKTRWPDLSKNFIETDNEGNGILRRRDIKNALYGFDIPLTPREFEKLWMRYDTEGRGHISYQEFLQKLGLNYLPAVHRPYADNHFNFMGHFTQPKQVQEEVRELRQSTERATRDKLKDHVEEISKALSKLDKSKNGYVPVSKMQKVLQECGCSLKEEELTSLLNRDPYKSKADRRFTQKRKRYREPGFRGRNWSHVATSQLNAYSSRSCRDKEQSLPWSLWREHGSQHLSCGSPNLVQTPGTQRRGEQTFSELDKEDTGFVKAEEFGQVLKDFCPKLSDNQYHYFLRKLRIHLTPKIHWKYFLQNLSSFLEETAAEWAEKMPTAPLLPTSPPPRDMGRRDILACLHKAVTTHYNAIAQEFKNFDTMKTNTASRDEFRAICNRHVQILTDEQFDKLWNEMPVTAKGKLKYQDFLSKFSSDKAVTPASGDSARAQRGSSAPELTERTRSALLSPLQDLKGGPKTWSHPSTPASPATRPSTPPLQNCEPIENRLRRRMQGCWRELLRECKEKDPNKRGEISASHFLALAEKFNLDISKEEGQQLVTKYDLKNNGKFAYCDFIQSCVLLLKAKETSLMHRMKIQNIHHMKEAGPETASFHLALLRIQPRIVHCWRPMRRTFKAYDRAGSGFLSVADFRKVLREYSINLSEEEFFHILEYYDKTLSSKISYNDFLRAFLQ
ncbi:EF-hand calcium-binding domain-containing protein 6 [Orycteropus afer afer]|uniref:EF-hand calcium-binding domain-containing protein 6 n=1 Tax=Orycteropus afer afer TaxID=1230840 RepID=A0A8B6ZWC7_ORYAF|nr:EF-hand calcium-binding domain-containing protein 6 [Orycteropus afer afer]